MGVDDSCSVVYTHTDTVMIYCSFIGSEEEMNSLFGPRLSKNPKSDVFNMFNYTQRDISTQLGIPFPVPNREHILSSMTLNITETIMGGMYLSKSGNKSKNTAYGFPGISFDIASDVSWKNPDSDPYAIEIGETFLQKLMNAAAPTQSIVGGYLNYIYPIGK